MVNQTEKKFTITVPSGTWRALTEIKLREGYKTLGDTVTAILSQNEKYKRLLYENKILLKGDEQ